MTLIAAWRKVQSAVFPWPRPDERQAAIEQARRSAERSRRKVEHAQREQQAIAEMLTSNHWAARITEQILAKHRGEFSS